jgi:transcriptional antiterminator RfaH
MPLLPLEPFVFPEALLSGPIKDEGSGNRWWVMHTRPRAEKSLARRFLGRGLSFFLPLHKRQWRHRGRVLCSYVPLFSGYIFLHTNGAGRQAALETNLVARCLPVDDQCQLHNDLARVHQLILSDAPLTPEERLQPGAVVEIVSGPFAGMEGKVTRRGKRLKLLVEVQLLQRGVSVEIESWMLQPIGSQPPR